MYDASVFASPARWVSRERVVASLVQADPPLAGELAEALPDTVDELAGIQTVRV